MYPEVWLKVVKIVWKNILFLTPATFQQGENRNIRKTYILAVKVAHLCLHIDRSVDPTGSCNTP